MLCRYSKLKVIHQNQYYFCVHIGTAVFGTMFWPWTLLNLGVSRLQIHRVSPLLPYLPIFHFFTYTTAPHFYSSLLRCKITVVYFIASVLYYVQSKTLFDQNETHAPISLSPTGTIPEPSDDAVFYYLNQILFASKFMVHNCCS